MFDIGKTDPAVLYDFCVLLESASMPCIDPDSELAKVFSELIASAWSALPARIEIKFGFDEES